MTVLGPLEARELGLTLVHEHLLFDFRAYWEPPDAAGDTALAEQNLAIEHLGKLRYNPFLFKDNLLHGDVRLAIDEVSAFTAYGGKTVVDPTNASLGRDPRALCKISRRTGLHIVMGAGYYTEIALGSRFTRSIDDLCDELIRELERGVGETGVRAGLIGEIGTSSPLTSNETRSLQAATRAQAHTGAPLMVHLDGWGREGHRVLDIVAGEGGDLSRTILCHMNPSCEDSAYQISLAERGAYVEYDMMGMTYVYPPAKVCPDDIRALRGVAELITAGHEKRILLSQDVFLKSMLKRYGGLGYTHLFENLPPLYVQAGITQEHLTTIFISNPARVLAYL